MPRKLADPRERFYDIRTGHYNLKYKGDSIEIFSKTFEMHQATLQRFHDQLQVRLRGSEVRVGGTKQLFVLTGLFQFVHLPSYYDWLKENDMRGSRGLAPLPPPARVVSEEECRFFAYHAHPFGRLTLLRKRLVSITPVSAVTV